MEEEKNRKERKVRQHGGGRKGKHKKESWNKKKKKTERNVQYNSTEAVGMENIRKGQLSLLLSEPGSILFISLYIETHHPSPPVDNGLSISTITIVICRVALLE